MHSPESAIREHQLRTVRLRIPLALMLAIALSAGCRSQVKVYQYTDDANEQLEQSNRRGIAYNIPQTTLEFTIDYELQEVGLFERDASGGDPIPRGQTKTELAFTGISEVRCRRIQSPDLWFVIDPESVQSFTTAVKKGLLKLDLRGFLEAVSAEFDDRSSEILQSAVKTTISAAKLAALALEGVPRMEERQKIGSLEYAAILTLRDFRKSKAGYYSWRLDPRIISAGVQLDHVDPLEVRLYPAGATVPLIDKAVDGRPLLTSDRPEEPWEGIVVGIPGGVRVEVIVGGIERKRVYANMMPLGGFTRIPFGGKAFSDRTAGLTFNTESGSLTEYSFSATASGEGLAGALESSSAEALKGLKELEQELIQHEIDALGKRGELLDTRREYHEKLKAYEEFLRSLQDGGD